MFALSYIATNHRTNVVCAAATISKKEENDRNLLHINTFVHSTNMGILDDTHNLYTTGHIFDPFLAYFVFGNPLLALAIAGIWEIFEYVIFESFGHYSVFFFNDSVGEEVWDILLLDIGGTLVGTLIAANLNFYLQGQFVPVRSLWEGTSQNKAFVVIWFVVRAMITMPFSALGWECNSVLNLCTDSGYHLLPWGVVGLLLVNGFYIWYYFQNKADENKKAIWMIVCLCVINLPTLQRAVPGSFLQIAALGSISILEFLVCVYLKYRPSYKNRKKTTARTRREDYQSLKAIKF